MASTYLYRSPSSSGTSNQKFTWSVWVKRSSIGNIPRLFEHRNTGQYYVSLRFRDDDNARLEFYSESNGGGYKIRTNRMFRDLHGWFHIVCTIDSTESTEADRMKMWVNGESITDFSSTTAMSYNADLNFNNSGTTQYVGRKWENSDYFDGQMTHVNYCDGYAYQASDFGQIDLSTGIWKPKTSPSVSYGNNGYSLLFENSGNMGLDSSGNSNNFTVSGSLTKSISTPSNIFATLNPLRNFSSMGSFSNCNNTYSQGSNSWVSALSTLGVTSGKYYYEAKWVSGSYFKMGFCGDNGVSGIGHIAETNLPGGHAWYTHDNGHVRTNNSTVSGWDSTDITNITSITNGSIMMIAVDMDNKFAYFGADGVWAKNGDPTSGSSGTNGLDISSDFPSGTPLFFAISTYNSVANVNFGEGFFGTTAVASAGTSTSGDDSIWEFDCPSGYYGLNTKNINAQEYS